MMTGKEKLYFLLDAIDDARQLAPSGAPLLIHSTHDLNRRYRDIELVHLFTKLQKDELVLKVLLVPQGINSIYSEFVGFNESDRGSWHIELQPAFDGYFQRIQSEPEYFEFTGKKPNVPKITQMHRKSLEKIWNVLQDIETKRGITNDGDDISIQFIHWSKVKNDREAREYTDERRNVLRKLELEYKAITEVRLPDRLDEYVYLKIGPQYVEVYNHIQSEYKKSATVRQNLESSHAYDVVLAELREANKQSSKDMEARYDKTISEIKPIEPVTRRSSTSSSINDRATYDPLRRSLSIRGQTIKYRESKRADIVNMLFKGKKGIATDVVLDKVYGIDISDSNRDEAEKFKKMVHSQYRGIAQEVASKSGVKDFLIFDFNSAQINPLYL